MVPTGGPRGGRATQGTSSTGPETQGSWFGVGASLQDPHDPAEGKAGPRQERDLKLPAFFRIYRAFLTARASLALLLAALLSVGWALGSRPSGWMLALIMTYCSATLILWWWPSQRKPPQDKRHRMGRRQAAATVGVDLLAFACMHYLSGSSFNSQALLALPVLMAATLLPRILALGVAAAATLTLLAAAWLQSGGTMTTVMTQAGLAGVALFSIAIMASELASRLAREERSARGSLEFARQQAQLNRLVIEEMADGVMVVDRQGRVRTANPAARRLLAPQGRCPAPPFQLRGVPAWEPLVRSVEQAFADPARAEVGVDLYLTFEDRSHRALRLRVRFTRGREGQVLEEVCVIFLEDMRTLLAHQRQDKLAAMGRMSAGIAHEIRNPLAAIAQANALLAEDAATPTQKKLTQLVGDNVARLKHIVDDVLAVAPGVRPPAPLIDLTETVAAICNDWRSTQGLQFGVDSVLQVDLSACTPAPGRPAPRVRFEPEHLQRVLVNLLDNALRHNSNQPGAILVDLRLSEQESGEEAFVLAIRSDGEPITQDTERSLFEPFFSTRSRGTGLGLYICRELCERHGASIDYRQHPSPVRHRNEFFVTMPAASPGPSPLTA